MIVVRKSQALYEVVFGLGMYKRKRTVLHQASGSTLIVHIIMGLQFVYFELENLSDSII